MAILFEVEENLLRGWTLEDCGQVYEDSCCEFFVADPFSDKYFNFEINCIGTLLAAKRKSREEFEFLSPLQFQEIVRFSSLPHDIIDSVAPNQKYWVAEVIPFSILVLQELPKILMPRFKIIFRCGENVGK